MIDRGSRRCRPAASYRKAVQAILGMRTQQSRVSAHWFTTFNDSSPQLYLDINRTMADSLGVTINDVSKTLQTYLGSTYVNLFNKFNQSFQVRVQAGADYRRQLEDIPIFTWLIATARWCRWARSSLSTAARIRTGYALQSLSRGRSSPVSRCRVQLGPGAGDHGTVR